jgi:hypothetical protein
MVVNFDGITALSDHDVLFRVVEQNCECGNPKFRKVVVLRWNGHSWNTVKQSDPDFYLPGACRMATAAGGQYRSSRQRHSCTWCTATGCECRSRSRTAPACRIH